MQRRRSTSGPLAIVGSFVTAGVLVASCTKPPPPGEDELAATARPPAAASAAPAPAATAAVPAPRPPIPDGPLGEAIKRGQTIVTRTYETLPDNVGNGLHCSSCHLDAGTKAFAAPWTGIVGAFPEFRARSARVDTIDRRINDCFERSMNGKALDPGSEDMAAIVAYMSYLGRDIPAGTVPGRGFQRIQPAKVPDRANGATVYQARCASCHAPDGAGISPDGNYAFPALWGPRSFNIAAGMARLDTAAAFVRANMPLGQGGTLTEQEAYDVADFFINQPRPDFAGKASDWPKGGKPRDARY